MSRILVTGATGFVGRAVIAALRTGGHLLTGTTRNAALKSGPEGTPLYVVPEFGPETDWTRAVTGAETVVHLAARTHVMRERAATALLKYWRVNVDGTKRLAEAAAAAGARHFVFMSSVKAAGEASGPEGLRETDEPKPEDAYGATKLEAERALAALAAETGLDVTILRPPLVYGPHARGNFLTLLKACDKRLPLPFGAVDNRRSLIYAANLADAVARAVEAGGTAEDGGCATYFVADGPPVSTPELIRGISAALGREPRLPRVPPGLLRLLAGLAGRQEEASRLLGTLVIDDSAFRRRFGWAPPATMEEGLAATARWFCERP